jgi:hypothetical protein
MTRPIVVLITALLACSAASAQKVASTPCRAHPQGETSAWRVYADLGHHFCFRYPTSYRPVAQPKNTCRKPALHDQKTGADIYVCVTAEKFRLSALTEGAPTGIDSPPEPVRIGDNTFYYYGPGGGGVSYPDQYFFNLRGKTLSIDFDGPYENDKTPSDEAKKMERKALASFREF